MGHVLCETLTLTADALSRYHLGQVFRDRVDVTLKEKGIIGMPVSQELF